MVIYEFRRADGSVWADYKLPKGAEIIRLIQAGRLDDCEALLEKETGRVAALIRRFLAERAPVAPAPPPAAPEQVAGRSLWGRLKWAMTGR